VGASAVKLSIEGDWIRHDALLGVRRSVLGEDRSSRSKRESEGDPEGSLRTNDEEVGDLVRPETAPRE